MRSFDIKPPRFWQSKMVHPQAPQIVRFFSYLETRGGIVGNKLVLFVYNDLAPELSYITTEPTI